jgi:class 3 adenylate cyclase/tetratricopeptide (TPR) repeat protein
MLCSACGTENSQGKKFCTQCGAALAPTCVACGAALVGGEKFCGECGTAVVSVAQAALPAAPRNAPAAERRLVSILFADLVGFTTLSESRDPEEVRELLSRYFDSCQRLISLFGGTVEKFIGDAVMAVWGTPAAQEDDAERAVRAALDLVAAVSALGDELDAPQLAARAGVLTGEAAVTLGAEGQGMVAGDLVNTASRIQAAAEPGTVLVGEVTKRASEAAVAYEDTGEHELKGKAEPVRLWRALRVTASRGGAGKAEGLEPPFVGRERELRLVKELFHASAEEGKAQLVSVAGIAGIGKSRLAWEFEKYLDGVLEQVWWHRGRCLAYGEGVAYWALAEMVRMRARISDEEPPETALAKLRAAIEEHVPDAEERTWLEPRLAHLLGLGERTAPDRDELFSAWRLFFERLADRSPTVLVFEDLQWADTSLLDFVEHLLDWSRSHPLFVLALARPELAERRPGWGAPGRNATTLSLEPLTPKAMEALLDGFVPGLPAGLRARILDRAEGVPLYAVETVRMLLDRALLERQGDAYRPTGPIDALDVPETLHALIAARLDGLNPEERRLVQDAAVLGKSFTKAGLAALSGSGEEELDAIVNPLVRKEIFSVQADPRSPERGQYSFLQDLLKRIAYETLARKDRKERHLAAAAHLEQAWGSAEQEVVEVVAAHYLDAYAAAPDAEDAAEIKSKAFERLVLAAERAASLAASEEAQHYYWQAAEIAADRSTQAELLEQAGMMALQGGRIEEAITSLERSIELFQMDDATHPAARVAARLGRAFWLRGDLAEGADRLEKSFQVLADDEPDADLAAVAAELGRLRFFLGEFGPAADRIDRALEIAESLGIPEVLSEALNTKHLVLDAAGRYEEALALLERAYAIALENELGPARRRALINLSYQQSARDNFPAAKRTDLEGLELARKRGDRDTEGMFLIHLLADNLLIGEWDEVLRVAAELDEDSFTGAERQNPRLMALPALRVARGELDEARRELAAGEASADAGEVQVRVLYALTEATVLRAEGRPEEALAAADRGLVQRDKLNRRHPFFKALLVEAVEAAFDLGDLDRVTELLGDWQLMRPTDRTPFLEANYARFASRLAARRGEDDDVEPGFARAQAIFRELGMPFYLGIALLEHGEWLSANDRSADAEPLLGEAREIFERLEAGPWLERATQPVGSRPRTEVAS